MTRARTRGTAAGERPRDTTRDDRPEGARENGGTAARGTRGGATVTRSRRGARTAIRLEGVSRLQVVSGKGGTGKNTVAAALALALATEGKRTLLGEADGSQGIAKLF